MQYDYLETHYAVALMVAETSDDAQTKIGAVLINKKTKTVVGIASNTFIFGANKKSIPNIRPLKYNFIVHAEVNLICYSAFAGVKTKNCVAFVTSSPCPACCRVLFQAGITTVYFPNVGWRKETEELGITLDITARRVILNKRFSKLKLQAVKC